jgi:hypothetical protein
MPVYIDLREDSGCFFRWTANCRKRGVKRTAGSAKSGLAALDSRMVIRYDDGGTDKIPCKREAIR